MSNCYQIVVPTNAIPCPGDLWNRLRAELSRVVEQAMDGAEDAGFDWDWEEGPEEGIGYLYAYAEDWGNIEAYPSDVLSVLGEIIKAAKLPYWEFGYAYYNDEMHPGSCGGGKFWVLDNGDVVFKKPLTLTHRRWATAIAGRIADEVREQYGEDVEILQEVLATLLAENPDEMKKLVGTQIIEEDYFDECI